MSRTDHLPVSRSPDAEPARRGPRGHPVWEARDGEVEVRFVAATPAAPGEDAPRPAAAEVLGAIESGVIPPVATVRQVHSGRAVEASLGAPSEVPGTAGTPVFSGLSEMPGTAGDGPGEASPEAPGTSGGLVGDGRPEADALWTRDAHLALAVVTADCVPLLLAGRSLVDASPRLAAVHAGWRGLVEGVVGTTVVASGLDPATTRAWIGPAAGPCCYEVGDDVAQRVAEVSRPSVVHERPGGARPHLALQAAARFQLLAAGVAGPIDAVAVCTICGVGGPPTDTPPLASYRRDGAAAGRNLAFVWRRAADAGRSRTHPRKESP